MKKIKHRYIFTVTGIASILIILGHAQTYAQIEKGNWAIGFDLGFSGSGITTEDLRSQNAPLETDQFSYNLSIGTGYFLKDNFMVGLAAGFDVTEIKVSQTGLEGLENIFLLNPFVQNYFFITDRLGFYVRSGVELKSGKNVTSLPDSEDTRNSIKEVALDVRPGIIFFVGPGFAIEAFSQGFGFRAEHFSTKSSDRQFNRTTVGFDANFQLDNLGLGARFFLNR